MIKTNDLPVLTDKDFASDQETRWCPGCGDYSILKQMQRMLPDLGIPREQMVFVSGIGCSSRFPYYMNTYGIHSIHGRAPAVATGIKCVRPDLHVWVITGDGDGLSIGAGHLMHIIRRNVNVNIVLFNNRIYGLTKGQYSPTSVTGQVTKSTPLGAVDHPLHPISVIMGAEGTFVARSVDVFPQHLVETLRRAAHHKGTSFVEVYQNCNVFNDGAWRYATDKAVRDEGVIDLQHGKPLLYGKNGEYGLRLNGLRLEKVRVGVDCPLDDIVVHDETDPMLGLLLAQLRAPEFPEPIGVFRALNRPTYDDGVNHQVEQARSKQGPGDFDALYRDGETWDVA